MSAPSGTQLVLTALTLLVSSFATADETEFRASTACNIQSQDMPTRASAFEPFTLAWLADATPPIDGGEQLIRCTTRVKNEGEGRKGVKVTLEGEILDLEGDTLQDLGRRSGKTDRDGYRAVEFVVDELTPPEDYVVSMEGSYSTRKSIEEADTSCWAIDRKPCEEGAETLCLLDDERFRVEVDWASGTGSGRGMVLSSTLDSGIFYFLSPDSVDLVVELFEECGTNDHFWVFYGATTFVEFALTITDTLTGRSRVYTGDASTTESVLDTSAFATCP